jgi:hypothetical protein
VISAVQLYEPLARVSSPFAGVRGQGCWRLAVRLSVAMVCLPGTACTIYVTISALAGVHSHWAGCKTDSTRKSVAVSLLTRFQCVRYPSHDMSI